MITSKRVMKEEEDGGGMGYKVEYRDEERKKRDSQGGMRNSCTGMSKRRIINLITNRVAKTTSGNCQKMIRCESKSLQ